MCAKHVLSRNYVLNEGDRGNKETDCGTRGKILKLCISIAIVQVKHVIRQFPRTHAHMRAILNLQVHGELNYQTFQHIARLHDARCTQGVAQGVHKLRVL